jgi:Fe-S cluster biogenesis protein NfuA
LPSERSTDVRTAGERVESLLEEVRAGGDPRLAAAAEELVHTLVDLYGEALSHVVRIVTDDSRPTGEAGLLDQFVADPLVESLLLVHDLHPLDVDTRVQRALDSVRPYLGSHAGGVRYHGVDADGMVRLTLEGSCHGCPSSAVTVQLAIEQAVQEAAPETAGVVVEGLVEEPPPAQGLLQIGRRPPDQARASAEPDGAGSPVRDLDRDGWAHLPAPPSDSAHPQVVTIGDTAVLVCHIGDEFYAYRDACPGCGSSLGQGSVAREALRCPRCGQRYNVRLAGVGLDDPGRHLDPLPLLTEGAQVRIAVGAPV